MIVKGYALKIAEPEKGKILKLLKDGAPIGYYKKECWFFPEYGGHKYEVKEIDMEEFDEIKIKEDYKIIKSKL